MDATIVLPIGTAPGAALAALQALAAVPSSPTFEVVVVDDASVGLEHLLAGLDGDVDVVRHDRPVGLAVGIADALAHARGTHVVVLDGPCQVDPRFLAPLLAALADPAVGVAAAGPAAAPVASHALAFRRGAVTAIPAVGDALVLPAIAAELGRGLVVAASVVHPPAPRGGAPAHAPGGDPEVTIVIPTLDAAGARTARCVRAVQAATDVPHEIVLVDNGAPPQGFSAPVNSGLRAARGRYAVVCNDDVEVLPGWWAPLRAALDDPASPAAVAFPLTIDGAMRTDFAAWCFAVSRATLEEHAVAPGEFLHPELRMWYQDTDLLHRLRRSGTPPRLVPESRIRHGLSETVGTTDPALRAWIDAQIRRDKARFEALHGAGVAGAAS